MLAAGIYGCRHFFLNSRFFTIQDCIVIKDGGYPLNEIEDKIKKLYTGRNIFTVNLKQISTMVIKDFPYLEEAEVRRSLPDKLEVNLTVRTPVAFIATGSGLVVDREAVVLAGDIDLEKTLVKIKGVSFFYRIPSPGQKVQTGLVNKALSMLGILREKGLIKRHNVRYIDVSDRNNILLCMDGVIVKMGKGGFTGKINRLNRILEDPKIEIKEIRYIDLRFEDAVISPR